MCSGCSLAEIWNAEDKDHALKAVKEIQAAYGAKPPKTLDDPDELLAFNDFLAEHWVHLCTTNPIDSTFVTVRHCNKVTNGPGSWVIGLAIVFKLGGSAQVHWRAVDTPCLVALVRTGARFELEREGEREKASTA